MIVGFALLFALIVIWFDRRDCGAGNTPASGSDAPRPASQLGRRDLVVLLLLPCAYLPLAPLLRAWASFPGFLPSDARTHALVAQHLFGESVLSGWCDRYVGGFPLALHYPVLGWLILGLPMRFGLNATSVVLCIGVVALVSNTWLVFFFGRLNRFGVIPSLTAALAIAWIGPLNSFVGGYESLVLTGLMSQVLVMPFVVSWCAVVLGRGSAATATLFASLSLLTHPQVSFAATLLLGLVVVATANRRILARYSLSVAQLAAVALFVHGPGIRRFELPFGWPPLPGWLTLGFGPDRLDDWLLDGDLLDNERALALTALWVGCCVLSLANIRKPVGRAAVTASVASIALSILGPSVADLGRIGRLALTVLQPLRAMALIPIAIAATVLVGLELAQAPVERGAIWFMRAAKMRLRSLGADFVLKRYRRWSGPQLASAGTGLWTSGLWLLLFLPMIVEGVGSRTHAVKRWIADLAWVTAEYPCGPQGPSRPEWEKLRLQLRALDSGRLWFDDAIGSLAGSCAQTTGFERETPVAIANTAGVGAHVGFLTSVNRRITPSAPGLSQRTEALGIRTLLLDHALNDSNRSSFDLLGRYGTLHLYSRVGGSDLFGVGCVRRRLTASNAVLEQTLKPQLADPQELSALLSPTNYTALTLAPTELRLEPVVDECDHTSGTLINELHSVGSHVATIETKTPSDVVLRVTAHHTWRVAVDGNPVSPQLVFPGYYAVRIAPGQHHLVFTHRLGATTWIGLFLGFMGPLALGIVLHGIRRRA